MSAAAKQTIKNSYSYDDLYVGMKFRSPGRTITDADLMSFAGLINDWKFVGPLFVGDTIFVNYSLSELRDSKSRPTQAVAVFSVELVNQNGDILQQGKKALLVSKVPLAAVAASL